MSALFPAEINLEALTAGKLSKLDSGGKMVSITIGGNPIKVELPQMRITFDVKGFTKDEKPPKFAMDLTFGGMESNAELQAAHDFFVAYDEAAIDLACAHAKEWFTGTKWYKESLSAEQLREKVKENMTSSVKLAKPGTDYPSSLKVAFKKRKGADKKEIEPRSPNIDTFSATFYNGMERDEDGGITQYTDMSIEDLLPRRTEVTPIVHHGGIWLISATGWGTIWKADQVRIDSRQDQSKGPAFRSDPSSIKGLAAAAAAAVKPKDDDDVLNAMRPRKAAVVATEDETNDQVEEPPKPKPKGKVPVVVVEPEPEVVEPVAEDEEQVAAPVPVPTKPKKLIPKKKPAA